MKISVVIPTLTSRARHGASRLRLTLAGYGRQTLDHRDYEVVIVDDGGDIEIEQFLTELGPDANARIIRNDSNLGMCSSFNRGIDESRGKVVLLGLDDEVPGPHVLEAHVEGHRQERVVTIGTTKFVRHTVIFHDVITGELARNALDPRTYGDAKWLPEAVELFGLADRIITPDGVRDEWDSVLGMSSSSRLFRDLDRVVQSGRAHEFPVGWLVMRVGNHAMRKADLVELGGVDAAFDQFSGWYLDLDLGLRAQDSGFAFLPVVPAVSANLAHVRGRSEVEMLAALALMYSKHPRVDVALLPSYFMREMTLAQYTRALVGASKFWPVQHT
jgi:glycosyltransferase involved in cell wall biosynthesis